MKELLRQVKQYKKDSILAPVYAALEVVMEVIIPFVMALLIDDGVEKGDMNKIVLYGALMIVFAIISLFAGMMAGKYAASASTGLPATSEKQCTATYSASHSQTSTSSAQQDL
mgnify:CR=1 FL=1